ncbi:MAG: metalloregulator ArsR/SmtB family transcription factor [Rhodovibrionaceae bacterium]|nr:metalloregulator ArsR/SmtB family transcription factor [Rhodovibrionaceae bacterium]
MNHTNEASRFLKALANPHRLRILIQLSGGEKSVSELERLLNLRQPSLSQHLARLRADKIVEPRRDGKAVYYALASPTAMEVLDLVEKAFGDEDQKPSRHAIAS